MQKIFIVLILVLGKYLPSFAQVQKDSLAITDSIAVGKEIVCHLEKEMQLPTLFTMWRPTSPFGWGSPWDIHEGWNAQIDLGVMVGFGKYNPFKGASFFTDVSLMYAKPLGKWTFALGGTLSRFKFFNDNIFIGDAFALANYKFDEHWSATVYASYNHTPRNMFIYDFSTFNENCARIGGEVTYRMNDKFALSVGVSQSIPAGQNPSDRPWKPHRPTKEFNDKKNW